MTQCLSSSRAVNGSDAKFNTRSCAGPWLVGNIRHWQVASCVVHGRRRQSVYDIRSLNDTRTNNKTAFNCTQWQI